MHFSLLYECAYISNAFNIRDNSKVQSHLRSIVDFSVRFSIASQKQSFPLSESIQMGRRLEIFDS